jgi:hypothetical protein
VKGLRIATLLVATIFALGAYGHGRNGGNKGGGGNRGGYGGSRQPIYNPSVPQTPSNPGNGDYQGGSPNQGNSGNAQCMDHGKTLNVDNEQALQWRSQQASGFRSRILISGTVDEVFSDQTGHRHFSVKIGPNSDDHIEVIYNESFGAMPLPQTGDPAEACGDYIVATQQNGGYPPSPDGALVHWVHRSPNGGHDNGFVILKGTMYGNH